MKKDRDRVTSLSTESPATAQSVPAVHVSAAAVIREVIADAGLGCLAGLLLAGLMQVLPVISRTFTDMLLWSLPPVAALYEEFESNLSPPFVPALFGSWGKLYEHVMPFLLLGGFGSLAGAGLAFFRSISQSKFGIPTQVKIGMYIGAVIGLSRGVILYLLGDLEHVMRVVGIALGWITAGAVIVLLITALKKAPLVKAWTYFPKSAATLFQSRALESPGSRRRGLHSKPALGLVCGVLVVAMLTGEAIDILHRRHHVVRSRADEVRRQERNANKGLRLGNLAGWKTPEGDVVISGYVSNEMDFVKSWMVTAELYAKDGRVTKTALLLNGEQRYSSRDYVSFKKRRIPYAVFRGENRQLQPKATRSFQLIFTDAPVSSETFTVYLKDVDFSKLTADDLWTSRAEIEKYLRRNAEHKEDRRVAEAKTPEGPMDQFPYPVHLDWTGEPNLAAVSRDKIAAIRRERIERYRFLNIYPASYTPDAGVFGQVDPKADWLNDAPLFIYNPYLLVMESGGNFVNSLFPYCGASSIVYANRNITVRYDDLSARKWLSEVEHLTDMPGIIKLWFPNALDAGFRFAYVDAARSVNIAPIETTPEQNIMNVVVEPRDFFHKGRRGHNNISPNDFRSKLKVLDKKGRTVIFVKLWKNKPQSAGDKEDFSYVIKVEPERKEVL